MADAEPSDMENIPMDDIRNPESKTASIETRSLKDESENMHNEQRRKEYDIQTDRERLAENNKIVTMPMEGVRKPKRSKRVVACISVLLVFCLALATTVGLVVKYQSVPRPSMQMGKNNASTITMQMGKNNASTITMPRCKWTNTQIPGGPSCVFESGKQGYKMVGSEEETDFGYRVHLERIDGPKIYDGVLFKNITVDIEYHNDHRLRIKFYPHTTRYEVPLSLLNTKSPSVFSRKNDTQYEIIFTKQPQFGVAVQRKSTKTIIFDTGVPGMEFSDQFMRLTAKLSSDNVYGFGEHRHKTFRHNMTWKTWSIFARDAGPDSDWNLYGAHPFYMNLEEDGSANGVFLKNSNAMEIALQPSPSPAITYRVIGGILDYYIFLGPTPENIVQQYTEVIGRPMMPPYWSLGFMLSRWGYKNLTEVESVVERTRAANIPQDVQFGDIDYMYDKMDFTYDKKEYKGLPGFVNGLHAQGQKYIVIIDHGIGANETILQSAIVNSPRYTAFPDGVARGIFVRNVTDGGPLFGTVWPGLSAFPDFTKTATAAWWAQWHRYLHNSEGVRFSGIWIDMNEPSSFAAGSTTGCPHSRWNYPPYLPNILGSDTNGMFDKTICMDAVQEEGLHYNVHNLYGHSMSIQTNKALQNLFPKKRPFVLTRSTFAGTGKYAAHWLGDNQSRWPHMHYSIIGMMEFSLFGFSQTGADICGFWLDAEKEMCMRWMLLGAFYPFSRNHNGHNWRPQDPAVWGDDFASVSRSILMTRYKLLPYLYTLLYHAHVSGSTVVRPLLHEFIMDRNTWNVDKQFMWGGGLLISPALYQGQTIVEAYFPKARWYDYFTGNEIWSTGQNQSLLTPLSKINLHIRGGHIIPWQEPANTTVYSRLNPLGLIVALDENDQAEGSLFWDDGESEDSIPKGKYLMLKFTVNSGSLLSFNVVHNGYPGANTLAFNTIDIFGMSRKPDSISVDGTELNNNKITRIGKFIRLSVNFNITQPHEIRWTIY